MAAWSLRMMDLHSWQSAALSLPGVQAAFSTGGGHVLKGKVRDLTRG